MKTKFKNALLILLITCFSAGQLSSAEELKLTDTQVKLVEAVIRYHFNLPGDPGQLIARIGMPEGKDPEQSFLNKFDDYAGYFIKLSDSATAQAENNLYWFMITDFTWLSKDAVNVYATDGHYVAIQEFRYKLERQTDGSWQVIEGVTLMPDPS